MRKIYESNRQWEKSMKSNRQWEKSMKSNRQWEKSMKSNRQEFLKYGIDGCIKEKFGVKKNDK